MNLTIDSRLLTILLAYHAGRPAQAVDHTHRGATLAQLVCGSALTLEDEDEDEGDDDDDDDPFNGRPQ